MHTDLLAKPIEGELEEDVMDVDGGAALGNSVKVIRDNLRLTHKDVAGVVCFAVGHGGRERKGMWDGYECTTVAHTQARVVIKGAKK